MGQMLVTNQQMDKLTASCMIFESCGMLKGICLFNVLHKLCILFNSTLTPLLTDKPIGQKKLMAICADNLPIFNYWHYLLLLSTSCISWCYFSGHKPATSSSTHPPLHCMNPQTQISLRLLIQHIQSSWIFLTHLCQQDFSLSFSCCSVLCPQ